MLIYEQEEQELTGGADGAHKAKGRDQ